MIGVAVSRDGSGVVTPIRTTHVGSLVRTPDPVEVMRAREHGEPVDPEQHARVLAAAANPRHEHEWRVWEEFALPDDKVLMPGLTSHATNVVEHPSSSPTASSGSPGSLGRSGWWRAVTAVSPRVLSFAACTPASSGRNSTPSSRARAWPSNGSQRRLGAASVPGRSVRPVRRCGRRR